MHALVDHRGAKADDLAAFAQPVQQKAVQVVQVRRPANNQLAGPGVAGLLHQRGIIWIPDYIAGAGGVIYALSVELGKQSPASALSRVQAITTTVHRLLDEAARNGTDPAQAAEELIAHRLDTSVPGPARTPPSGAP